MFNLGSVYFYKSRDVHSRVTPRMLCDQLNRTSAEEDIRVIGNKKIIIDRGEPIQLPARVVEVAHAINNFCTLKRSSSKMSVREILGIDPILKRYFNTHAKPVCTDIDCKKHLKPLSEITPLSIPSQILSQAQKNDIIYLSYAVEGSFEKCVWEYREAISLGYRRFLIHGAYYTAEDFSISNADERLVFTNEERNLFQNVTTYEVIERTLSCTEDRTVEDLIQTFFSGNTHAARAYSLGVLRKTTSTYTVVAHQNVGGSHYCDACTKMYDLRHGNQFPQPQMLLTELTCEAFMEADPSQIREIVSMHGEQSDISDREKILAFCNSSLCKYISKSFIDLSSLEQLASYLFGCCMRDVGETIFVYAPLAFPHERNTIVKEIETYIYALLAKHNAWVFGAACMHMHERWKDATQINEAGQEDKVFIEDTYIDMSVSQIERRICTEEDLLKWESLKGLIHICLSKGDDLAFRIKQLLFRSEKKKGAKNSVAGERVSFSYFDDQFQIESKNASSMYAALSDQELGIFQILQLDETLAELYAATRSAISLNMYFQDFVHPEKSLYRCKFCNGERVIRRMHAYGYVSQHACRICMGTGGDAEFERVRFLDKSYREALNLTLPEFYEAFLINEDIENQKAAFDVLSNKGLILNNIRLNAQLSELSEEERLSLAIFILLLNAKPGGVYYLELILEPFLVKNTQFCGYIDQIFEERGSLLISSYYK